MSDLKGKTLFITGASRGIGLAIALRAARDGANIVIAAKSDVPNPKLPGTIHSAAKAVEEAGGKALALRCDIREEEADRNAVAAILGRADRIAELVRVDRRGEVEHDAGVVADCGPDAEARLQAHGKQHLSLAFRRRHVRWQEAVYRILGKLVGRRVERRELPRDDARRHVEGEDRCAFENIGHLPIHDLAS